MYEIKAFCCAYIIWKEGKGTDFVLLIKKCMSQFLKNELKDTIYNCHFRRG